MDWQRRAWRYLLWLGLAFVALGLFKGQHRTTDPRLLVWAGVTGLALGVFGDRLVEWVVRKLGGSDE